MASIRVNGPDGLVVNFPAGTDHETIDRVVREAAERRAQQGRFSRKRIFTIETPSGRRLKIEAHDQETALRGAQEWEAGQTRQPMPAYAGMRDVAKSAGTGLMEGVAGLGGMLGDTQALTGQALRWASEKTGIGDPDSAEEMGSRFSPLIVGSGMKYPRTSEITDTAKAAGVPFHEPQSTAGEYARTFGQFAPAAAAGPGGLIRKGAMMTVPAATSETLGQATTGTDIEPWARMGGALLGGGLAAGGTGRNTTTKSLLKDSPDYKQVVDKTNRLYDRIRKAGIAYDGTNLSNFATRLEANMVMRGFREARAPDAKNLLTEMRSQAGKPVLFDDLDSIRRAAGDVAYDSTASNAVRKWADEVIRGIDTFIDGELGRLSLTKAKQGAQMSSTIRQARDMASRRKKAETPDRMFAAAQDYKTNGLPDYEKGLRSEFTAQLRRIDRKQDYGWSKEEIAAMRDVADGNRLRNAANAFGKLGFSANLLGNKGFLGSVAGALTGATYVGGPPLGLATALGGAATMAAGSAARYGARKATEAAADRALKTVLAGKQAQKTTSSATAQERDEIAARRLLSVYNSTLPFSLNPVPQGDWSNR